MKTYLAVFASVLVAELGDKTQIATLLYATDPTAGKLGVFLAAAAALVLSSALAVAVGAHAGGWLWISPKLVRTVAGLGFVAVGVWVLLT
jgi:putative Ca2+/H+ antiporter (TMEM165/GDT1 family)